MNKKERVIATLEGQKTQYIPAGFWLHFPEGFKKGENAVKIHLDFAQKTGCDICKIMNECFLSQGFFMEDASDWNKIKKFDRNAKFIQDQIDLVKRIVDEIGNDVFILATIHDICASVSHVLRNGNTQKRDRLLQTKHLRENPDGMRVALDYINETNIYLAEECLKAGADGIYYAVQNRKIYDYTHEEFESFIKPYDIELLNSINKLSKYNVLHICKDNVDFNEYKDYPSNIVNWDIHCANPDFLETKDIFPNRIILGGINNKDGVLIEGTKEDIEKEVKSIINKYNNQPFILGADCTLPQNIDYSRIRCAVEAAHNL